MDFSGHAAMRLRTLGRRLGILPPLVRAYRRLSGANYEQRFDDALMRSIRNGDMIWDVGANLGLYTRRFAAAAGPQGRVVAFEPSPGNLRVLRELLALDGAVTVMPVALSDRPGMATLYLNGDDQGVTDSLVPRTPDAIAHEVPVRCGDDFLELGVPNVIKIDVEGFELEVLRGMPSVLASCDLRSVLIEVHFGILNDRGLPDAPAGIVGLLSSAGFEVSWVDSSHLVAQRAA